MTFRRESFADVLVVAPDYQAVVELDQRFILRGSVILNGSVRKMGSVETPNSAEHLRSLADRVGCCVWHAACDLEGHAERSRRDDRGPDGHSPDR